MAQNHYTPKPKRGTQSGLSTEPIPALPQKQLATNYYWVVTTHNNKIVFTDTLSIGRKYAIEKFLEKWDNLSWNECKLKRHGGARCIKVTVKTFEGWVINGEKI